MMSRTNPPQRSLNWKHLSSQSKTRAYTQRHLQGFSELKHDKKEALYLPLFTSLSISCLLCLLHLFISFIRRPSLTSSISPSACSHVHTSFFLLHFPFFVPNEERWQLWQRQSADAGLKSDRPCPAATQLGSQRSITPWHTQSSTRREKKAGDREEKEEDGWRKAAVWEQKASWKKNNSTFCHSKIRLTRAVFWHLPKRCKAAAARPDHWTGGVLVFFI